MSSHSHVILYLFASRAVSSGPIFKSNLKIFFSVIFLLTSVYGSARKSTQSSITTYGNLSSEIIFWMRTPSTVLVEMVDFKHKKLLRSDLDFIEVESKMI